MYRLMADHYEDVVRSDFERDLTEKQWVIVTSSPRQGILGFTTLMLLRAQCENEPVLALYCGDTVLDADIWGAGGWARAWGRLAARIAYETQPKPLYLLLLTATHRTYRFLPTFLKEYYPRPDAPTPPIYQNRIEALVHQKFPDEYDAVRGIVRTRRPLSVRQKRVEMATMGMDDVFAKFFAKKNPGYLQGDYLVCIADLSPTNRTRLGQKFLAFDDA
jgi:hypothetical protein